MAGWLACSLSLTYSIRGRRCGGAELGSRISSLCCSCRPGFVSNFMSVDVADRGHMCSLALKMSHVAKMSSAIIPISLAVFQRAQWGLGVTACRHASLPNGSSCTLVPFPLFERAFPDGTNPLSPQTGMCHLPAGSELSFWPLTSTNKWQLALFDQPKWEHMWRTTLSSTEPEGSDVVYNFLPLSVSRCGMWCQLRIFFCCNNSFQSALNKLLWKVSANGKCSWVAGGR